MRHFQLPAICTFGVLIAFFGGLDMVCCLEVVFGIESQQLELAAEFPCNPHQDEGESEKESKKTGEENESKESKKKVFEVDDCDGFGSEKARDIRLKSRCRLGNSSSILALAAARIWEPPELG